MSRGAAHSPDFSELITNHKEVRLGLLLDASDTTLATSTEGFLTAIVRTFYTHTRLERTPLTDRNLRPEAVGVVTPVRRVLFNPTLSGTAYTLPGLLGMICLFLTVFITAIALVRERETGTLEQLLVTPVTSTEVVLGKILPFGIVAMGAVIFCIGAGWLLFDLVPVGSTLLLLAVNSHLFVDRLGPRPRDFQPGPLFCRRGRAQCVDDGPADDALRLSLSLAPASQPFRTIGEIFPLTHYLRVTRGIYLKGQGFAELWPEIAVLFSSWRYL